MPISGYCNRCGVCCTLERNNRTYRCEHLIVVTEIGKPNGSLCGVHDARTHGMPITLKADDGSTLPERCIPEYPVDGETSLPKECSYRL